MSETFVCPVCGYTGLDEPARTVSNSPSWDYCMSCGFQFGVTDDDRGETYASWRAKWVADGMRWWARWAPPPADWDPRAQLAALGLDPNSG